MAKIGKMVHHGDLEAVLSFVSMFHKKTTFPSFLDVALESGALVLANEM